MKSVMQVPQFVQAFAAAAFGERACIQVLRDLAAGFEWYDHKVPIHSTHNT